MTVHRVDLHNELLRLATTEHYGDAPEAKLLLSSKVVGASADDGTLTLADGRIMEADLIIAADGVHSVLRDVVLEPEAPQASATGLSSCRLLIPTKDFLDDTTLLSCLRTTCTGPTVLVDPSKRERHMVWYDCRGWGDFLCP